MIIDPIGFWALPFLLGAELTSVLLWIIVIRLVLDRLPSLAMSPLYLSLKQLTDPAYDAIDGWTAGMRSRANPPWLAWAVLIIAAVVLRHLLLGCAVMVS